MKRSHNLLLLPVLCLFINSCNKEDEVTSFPYKGEWETATYAVQIDEQGSLVNRKMVCSFENDSFVNSVTMVIGHIEEPLCGIKGSIERTGENNLHLVITQLGRSMGTYVAWSDSAAAEFDTLYTQYAEFFMPSQFDATYLVDGEIMDLIVTASADTIRLSRL